MIWGVSSVFVARLLTAAPTVLSAKGLTQSRWIPCLERGQSLCWEQSSVCLFDQGLSSKCFQTVAWTGVTAQWHTRRGTLCQLSLGMLIVSKFTWAEYELAVPGGNVLEVYKSEDTESEGPWSQAKQAVTRRRLGLPCNHARQSWSRVTEDSRTEFKLNHTLWRALPVFVHMLIPTMIASSVGGSIPCASKLHQRCGSSHLPCTAPCLCHHFIHGRLWLLALVLLGPHKYTLGEHRRKLWKFLGCKIIAKCIQTAVTIC